MQTERVRDRLKNVRVNDKYAKIENMLKILKCEEYKLLTNYLYLSVENLNVYIDITENGEYILTIKAVTDRLIDSGRII